MRGVGSRFIAASIIAASFATSVQAAETRGFVVSWFYLATHSDDGDCAQGINPKGDVIFARILREQGKSPQEIEKLVEGFPFTMAGPMISNRGKIDGKPVNVYVNPTSVPDPQMHLVTGKVGYGFNLDNNENTGGFTDPETGTKGVDNQVVRAVGCFSAVRALPPARPGFTSIQWDTTRDQMPAWLIEVTGIDDPMNDDDVQVAIYRAVEPIVRDASSQPQSDLTFRVDPDLKAHNVVHGRIKNGLLTTDAFDFFMTGDPFAQPEYPLKKAQLRLTLSKGGAKGYLGGYQPWEPIYFSFAIGGALHESNLSLDMPGIYYAMRKMADFAPDPKTGFNYSISATYLVEAVPAYIDHAKQTAQVKP